MADNGIMHDEKWADQSMHLLRCCMAVYQQINKHKVLVLHLLLCFA
jgi:hypothetical protein